MTDDLNRLRAVAQAATPGRWRKYNDGVVGFPVDEETGEGIGKGFRPAAGSDTDYDQRLLDAIYVATFDPPTVLALIDRAERAELALALMSSLAINPAIPYEFRAMMRTSLGEPPLSPWEAP